MPSLAPIDTRHVNGRRELHFQTVDDALADGEMLAKAHREGNLRCMGNWTPGQNLGHIAAWINYSYEGAPLKVPLLVRLMMRPMKRRFLYKPMAPGARIPKVPGGTIGFEPLSFEEGYDRFRRAFLRLKESPPPLPHLLFGPLTHAQWICSHLRHAELHLSFMRTD
jgi:hypothetical protein